MYSRGSGNYNDERAYSRREQSAERPDWNMHGRDEYRGYYEYDHRSVEYRHTDPRYGAMPPPAPVIHVHYHGAPPPREAESRYTMASGGEYGYERGLYGRDSSDDGRGYARHPYDSPRYDSRPYRENERSYAPRYDDPPRYGLGERGGFTDRNRERARDRDFPQTPRGPSFPESEREQAYRAQSRQAPRQDNGERASTGLQAPVRTGGAYDKDGNRRVTRDRNRPQDPKRRSALLNGGPALNEKEHDWQQKQKSLKKGVWAASGSADATNAPNSTAAERPENEVDLTAIPNDPKMSKSSQAAPGVRRLGGDLEEDSLGDLVSDEIGGFYCSKCKLPRPLWTRKDKDNDVCDYCLTGRLKLDHMWCFKGEHESLKSDHVIHLAVENRYVVSNNTCARHLGVHADALDKGPNLSNGGSGTAQGAEGLDLNGGTGSGEDIGSESAVGDGGARKQNSGQVDNGDGALGGNDDGSDRGGNDGGAVGSDDESGQGNGNEAQGAGQTASEVDKAKAKAREGLAAVVVS